MPIIKIEFDDQKVSTENIAKLSEAVQKIVIQATGIGEVFVYANSAQIKVNIEPIEIFVEMSAGVIKNLDELMAEVKTKIVDWKKENNFTQPINLTIIPMQWKFEIGI